MVGEAGVHSFHQVSAHARTCTRSQGLTLEARSNGGDEEERFELYQMQ